MNKEERLSQKEERKLGRKVKMLLKEDWRQKKGRRGKS